MEFGPPRVFDRAANLMEFDERLQRTFESLTARLQQEIAGQLDAAGDELSAAVSGTRGGGRGRLRSGGCPRLERRPSELTAGAATISAGADAGTRGHARAETQARAEVQAELAASHTAAARAIESHKTAIEHLIESHKAASERLVESHKAASDV